MAQKKITRRRFLAQGAALGAAAACPAIVPSTVLGATAPSNRINLGMIGMGLMMRGHLNGMLNRKDVQVLAVCDVYRDRRESNKKRVEDAYADRQPSGSYRGCAAYLDYQQLCDRPEPRDVGPSRPG